MTQLTLTAPGSVPLRPFVQGALDREADMVEASIERTQQRIRHFEEQYQMSSEQFLDRYRKDEIQETLETIEWLGEYRMLISLHESLSTLQGIKIED